MKFNSAQEIYDYIHAGNDLYDVDEEIYLFDYNWVGAIAYYYLSEEALIERAKLAGPNDYIAGTLGPGGYILDVNLIDPDGDFVEYDSPLFEEFYDDERSTLDYSDILDFLSGLVGDEFIDAMPSDLVDFEEE